MLGLKKPPCGGGGSAAKGRSFKDLELLAGEVVGVELIGFGLGEKRGAVGHPKVFAAVDLDQLVSLEEGHDAEVCGVSP